MAEQDYVYNRAMPNDIYERLAVSLDNLPGGFARTESGVELRILRRLFTPQEAVVACCLNLIAEEPRVIARRAGLPLAETTRILESLAAKRLVLDFPQKTAPSRYMGMQFVVGFWEGQVDRLDRGLVEDFEEYLPAHADTGYWGIAPQLRTIPVRKSIPHKAAVLSYEHIDTILGSHQIFAVANCICRQEMHIIDQGCKKPIETCLAFDGGAEYFVRSGRGRWISREEALNIIERGEKAGLVLQAGNDQSTGNLCMCCGCCCGVLRALKRHPQPSTQVSSPFHAQLDLDKCRGCAACTKRCPMDALTMQDGQANLNLERCIGCGLCVAACPEDALELERKVKPPAVPRDTVWLYLKMAWSRGKLGPLELVGMLTRSGYDRLMTLGRPRVA